MQSMTIEELTTIVRVHQSTLVSTLVTENSNSDTSVQSSVHKRRLNQLSSSGTTLVQMRADVFLPFSTNASNLGQICVQKGAPRHRHSSTAWYLKMKAKTEWQSPKIMFPLSLHNTPLTSSDYLRILLWLTTCQWSVPLLPLRHCSSCALKRMMRVHPAGCVIAQPLWPWSMVSHGENLWALCAQRTGLSMINKRSFDCWYSLTEHSVAFNDSQCAYTLLFYLRWT